LLLELRSERPEWNIEIVGINWITSSSANPLMTAGRILPWLQTSSTNRAESIWGATYRDVRILDPENRLVGLYNLSANDLGQADRRAAMKSLFVDAARVRDTDQDRLPDAWELIYFGNLNALPLDDSDGDGSNNFTELAFGSHPNSANIKPAVRSAVLGNNPDRTFNVALYHLAGNALNYGIETSVDLRSWTVIPPELLRGQGAVNFFDGTGIVRETFALHIPETPMQNRFLRFLVTPRTAPAP
jgi:hypothetical protein